MPASAYERQGFLDLHGGVVLEASLLQSVKARAVAEFAAGFPQLRADVLEMRQGNVQHEGEPCSSLLLRIRTEIGPQPPVDIRQSEDVLIVFRASDDRWPSVYALRDDFPNVLHVNASVGNHWPHSLCLSERSWYDIQNDWTPAYILELLHVWLSETARGTLHRSGQPVEAFMIAGVATLIVPHQLFTSPLNTSEAFILVGSDSAVLRLAPRGPEHGERDVAVIVVSTPSRVHGNQLRYPYTLSVLNETIGDGYDLSQAIRSHLDGWRARPALATETPLLVVQVPITRTASGPIERYDVYAFLLSCTALDLGAKLGLWDRSQPLGTLLGTATADIGGIDLTPLNVQRTLSAPAASHLNAIGNAGTVRFSAVGAGALGSQLLVNLARAGLRPRLVADADHLLPHNLARHALFDSAVGETKASSLAIALNSILDEPPTVNGLAIDVLDPRRADRAEVFRDVDTVLDLSASVAVSRHLSVYSDRDARRIAIFLSPTGNDLVVLAEDRERTVPLDGLEMNYYWDVATNESLAGHFGAPETIRYGVSCRDVSSFIPQSVVAIHAGNAARALSRIFHESHASSFLWSLDAETGTVLRTNLGTSPMRLSAVGEWTVAISERLVEDLACERMRHVPRETGGLLIGRFDHLYKRVYVVGYLPAPPDSISWPSGFIRGVQGIRAELDNVTARTANALEYVGEWHSHPEFTSSAPSHTDEDLYRWLDGLLRPTGKPPVMLIIGSDGARCVMAVSETSAVP